ncbi:cyanophycinase [Christiangramia sediminis]|uniref:Cyanophycinase n=1 Tax=Christiangramia sediminis TaxID=2881336 RepID=A0A9X1LG34_9FLAO|nr:cyanophycinase [Christiangramia sediminis]MCB7479717.1 cyanophycinase [Christiangramia sediminis]
MKSKGTLIPIGGNENKGTRTNEKFHTEKIEKGILSRLVIESGGVNALIVVIPTASSIPVQVSESYLEAFGKLGCRNIRIADIRSREDSEKQENIDLITKADCVMFSGGNQSEIINKIKDTSIHTILMDRYHNSSLVIAGTSAGAMCMSEEMITGGRHKEAFVKGAVGMSKGMGFLQKLIIDSHFIRRGRFGRLAEAVAKFPEMVGIGLAEDTGLVIKECNTVEIVGTGMVIIFDPGELEHNTEKYVKKGELMSVTNLKTHILAQGDIFNIEKHQVKILHVETPLKDIHSS